MDKMVIVGIVGITVPAILMVGFIVDYLRKRNKSQEAATQVSRPTDRIVTGAKSPYEIVEGYFSELPLSDDNNVMVIQTFDVPVGLSEDEILKPLETVITRWTGRLDVEPVIANGDSSYQTAINECVDDLLFAMDEIRNKMRSENE